MLEFNIIRWLLATPGGPELPQFTCHSEGQIVKPQISAL